MGLPRTFVGFSSTDIHYYRLMCAWKNNQNIDFNFADCQLSQALNSEDEMYIKRICRERIKMAGTFISLIGQDTKSKHKYVRWELEVALEKSCRVIGVNIDGSRRINPDTCPKIIQGVGAIFIPFSQKIITYALENYQMNSKGNWHYPDELYQQLSL